MQLLTSKEVAKLLGLSLATVYRMAKEKKIPHFKINNELRFKMDELNKWLRAQRVA